SYDEPAGRGRTFFCVFVSFPKDKPGQAIVPSKRPTSQRVQDTRLENFCAMHFSVAKPESFRDYLTEWLSIALVRSTPRSPRWPTRHAGGSWNASAKDNGA